MDDEIRERFDKIDKGIETLTNMLADMIGQLDSNRSRASATREAVAKQVDMAKKMALSNPMIKGNPQAMKYVDEMFSAIPGGSE